VVVRKREKYLPRADGLIPSAFDHIVGPSNIVQTEIPHHVQYQQGAPQSRKRVRVIYPRRRTRVARPKLVLPTQIGKLLCVRRRRPCKTIFSSAAFHRAGNGVAPPVYERVG
jgi:hypothetical protein